MVDGDAKPRGWHWRRYRRLLAMMFGLAVVTITGTLFVLHGEGVVLRLNVVIALTLGIGVSLMLAGALMGLLFVSANSGHDDAVERPLAPPRRRGGPWP
jgi:uncharacterized BrkB/YihY/UPF0761 family membrane protein